MKNKFIRFVSKKVMNLNILRFNYLTKNNIKNKLKEINSIEDAEKYLLEKSKSKNVNSKHFFDEKCKLFNSSYSYDNNKILCSYTFKDANNRYNIEVNFPTNKNKYDDCGLEEEEIDEISETELLVFITLSKIVSIEKIKEEMNIYELLNIEKQKNIGYNTPKEVLFIKGFIRGRKLDVETYNIFDNSDKLQHYKYHLLKGIKSKDISTNDLHVLDIEVQNRFNCFLHELGLNYDTIDLIVRLSDYLEQEQLKHWNNKINSLF